MIHCQQHSMSLQLFSGCAPSFTPRASCTYASLGQRSNHNICIIHERIGLHTLSMTEAKKRSGPTCLHPICYPKPSTRLPSITSTPYANHFCPLLLYPPQ